MAFDLLHQDGREFIGRPLRERRARLEEVVAGSDFVLPVRRLARNGFEAWGRRGDQPLGRRRLTRLLVRVAALVHVAAFG
jgi:hypothetical protein